MSNAKKSQQLFHKYQKIYAFIGIIYNIILIGLIIFAFTKYDGFNIEAIVIGINGIYAVFDLITTIIFILSKPFDQDISKATLITSISDTLFHNGLAAASFVIVSLRKTRNPSLFWKLSFWIVLFVFLRSLVMLAAEVYWWIMLKNTVKEHTEDDFIIPEDELNTQYHQISYDYHNPKRLFNQSNVVILNKKQKKKLKELQQQEEDLILEQIEKEDSNLPASNSLKPLNRQEQNKAMINDYIKERIATDNESNYQYLRQQQERQQSSYPQDFLENLSSSPINQKASSMPDENNSDSDSDSDDSDSNLKTRPFRSNHPSSQPSEPMIVEMYSNPNHPRRNSISSSSSSSQTSPSDFPSNQKHSSKLNNHPKDPPSSVFINMKNASPTTTMHSELDTGDTSLTNQKNKVLEYMDKLIQENKEKKKVKQQKQQENPQKYHRNHPQEWFSQVMGVKEIQEEKDAKLFVKVKQKKEKELIEQKMENLKEELNHANTPEQVETIFRELKALNGIW